ncbi:hypothetical protein HW115_01165 [Verrucomicrobiaceae bacterium N1E253]|uniref:Uncharacterized protein n=1 Tax=Oceaniferula marina TaxID=2748318 RepID=A0A851GJ21_9BACT|nr:hypothetical protein [Oceaniferula marina]NWK54204.1 hypothetical protein [Oceaniferula marina]
MKISTAVIQIRQRPVQRGGFALVATMSVMVILLMVALSMLSLSTITLRESGQDEQVQVARANARLALMHAIGELQLTMGPDQRVSAEGAMTGEAGHGKSHWVGAWSSEDEDGDDEPDGTFEGWLVSRALGGEVSYESIQSNAPTGDQTWVRLVGAGSANTKVDTKSEVLVERVRVMGRESGMAGSRLAGHYAWWVGDEGVKARVDMQNIQQDANLASQGTQRSSIEVIPGFESVDSTGHEIRKMVTTGTAGKLRGASVQALKDHFHSMTVHSLALQTDTRQGGLKTDLSLLFEMTDEDFEAIDPANYAPYVNAQTPVSDAKEIPKGLLFYDQGIHGPTIDLLRNHYRQYKTIRGDGASPMKVAHASFPNKTEFGQGMWRRTACIHAWHWGLHTDPNTSKRIKPVWWGSGDFPVTRLLKGNVTPYLNRVMMYFSVQAVPLADATPDDFSDDTYNLHLKLQPILYVHNPYNVRMRVDGMRYLKNISEAQLWIRKNRSWPEKIDFGSLLDANDEAKPITSGDRNGEAQFVVDHAVDFAPGEMKIFVPSRQQSWGTAMKMKELGDAFQPDEMALTVDLTYVTGNGGGPTAAISQIPSGSQLQISLRWGAYAKEDFELYEHARGGYNTVWSGLSQWRPQYSTGALTTNGWSDAWNAPSHHVEDLMTITPVVVDDRFVKPAKFDRYETTPNGNRSVATVVGPSSFVMGNPLSSSDSNVLGVISNCNRIPGAGMYSNITHSHMDYGQVGYPYFQNAFIDNYGTWGSNNGAAGERYSTVLEVPTAPVFSLGALQHANIAVEGYQPGLAIGNSLPNLTMRDHTKIVEPVFGQQNYDLSYMTNRALWDAYFFSSITPRPEDASYASLTLAPIKDIERVVSEFVSGKKPLGNSRMRLITDQSQGAKREQELKHFQMSAAHLGVAGGFNVNSTSVEAWSAFLSGYRDATLRTASGVDKNDEVSAFPRMTLSVDKGGQDPVADNERAWTGFSQLSDTQVEELAKEIVTQLQSRAKLRKGEAAVTPCLTMGQFVNRMLTGNDEVKQRGILQAAIEVSGLNETMDNYGTYDCSLYGSQPEQHAYLGDGKNTGISAASSSPSYVLQGDILQALGASMTVRSDTFIIRSYGDAVDANGEVTARAWCEAIVQRVPEPVIADTDDVWQPADQTFGRRMKIVSFRWLSKEEV